MNNVLAKFQKRNYGQKNKLKAANTFAILSLAWFFGVIKRTTTELEEIDRRVRTALTEHRMHYPRSGDAESQRKKRAKSIYNLHCRQIKQLREYFLTKAKRTEIYRSVVKWDTKVTTFNLSEPNYDSDRTTNNVEIYIDSQKRKQLHGKYPQIIEQHYIDSNTSYQWLKQGYLYSEIEGSLIAIQDQAMNTKYYRRHMIKDQHINDRCRLFNNHPETIDHIIKGCTTLAATESTKKHNNI